MKPAVILGFARTPIGSIGGSLREVHPDKLGALVLGAAMERSGAPAESLARVILGTTLDAGRGPNPARALVLEAGFEFEGGPPGVAVKAGGGSGLEALALATGELEGD